MIQAYRMTNDRILSGRLYAQAGDTVYHASGYDYGLARDDTYFTGVEHISVTLNADGSYPSFTCPVTDLAPIIVMGDYLDTAAFPGTVTE